MALPRLGVDIAHPTAPRKPSKAEMEMWLQRAPATCILCAGTGHQYAEQGLFKACSCRVRTGAPAHVRDHLYVVF